MRLSLCFVSLLLLPLSASADRVLLRDLSELSDVPSKLNEHVLVDVRDSYDPSSKSMTPLFFHIPKAGGTTMQDLTAFCLHLVTASEVGVTHGHDHDTKIRTMSMEGGATFVNVDTTSKEGLDRAQHLGFVDAELADIVFTGILPKATHALFDEHHKASMFTIFRHPSERQISLFYYLQDATWEHTYHPDWKDMKLDDYLKSEDVEQDWVARSLLGRYTGNLDDADLEHAKEIVSNRMWVGLITEMEESINRFGAIYGWSEMDDWETCMKDQVQHVSNHHKHPKVDRNSETWKLLEATNFYDLQLYDHAVAVFEAQRQFFTDIDEST
jgi:hypothetical protein